MGDDDLDEWGVDLTGPFVQPREDRFDYLEQPATRHELMMLLGPVQNAVLRLFLAEAHDRRGDDGGRLEHLQAARAELSESLAKFRALMNAGVEPRTGEEL
ncbi:MAG TPA: hypothetical protein VM662_14050 [Sphingomonas sp.]|nr:hypothetical protein [Sphingomonas sp.]